MTLLTSRRRLLAGAALLASPALIRRARAASGLRMGDQRGNVQAVMQAAGVLNDLPYELTWSEFAAAAPLIEAVNAGAVDGGNVGDAPFTFGFAAGVKMKAIAVSRSSQQGTAILVKDDSPAHAFSDLAGKRVATGRGSVGHFLVLMALRRAKLDVSAIQLTFLQPADAKAALLSGSVDAWSTWEPYTSQLELLNHGRQVVNGVGLTPGLGYQIATDAAIAEKRPMLEDFVARMTRARKWAATHPEEYAVFWAKLMNFPESIPRQWFGRTRVEIVPADEAVFRDEQGVIDVYAGAGMLARTFEARSAIDAGFNAAVARGNGVA